MNEVVEGFQRGFAMIRIFKKRVDGGLDRVSAFQKEGLRESLSEK